MNINFLQSSKTSVSFSSELSFYMGLNEEAFIPVKAEPNGQKLIITSGGGTAELSCAENALNASFSLTEEPQFVYPVFNAMLSGLEGAFCQGFGLGGPTGYYTSSQLNEKKQVFSYGVIAYKLAGRYFSVYSLDNSKYIQRSDLTYNEKAQCFMLSCGFNIEKTAKSFTLPALYFAESDNLEQLLAEIAAKQAKAANVPPMRKPAYNWCSWYYYYNNFDYNQLREFLEGLKAMKNAPKIETVQIDAGYFPSAGDWLYENPQWEGGLKKAFALIKQYGYKPGIWIAPFMVGNRSTLYKQHPDWVLKTHGGNLIMEWQMYNEPKVWGYQDEEYYVLDASNPEALSYIANVCKTMHEWGAEFFKTDFMLWGIQSSDKVKRFAPGKTSVEYYRILMQTIKDAIGESYWLGCIAPMLPSLGFVNGMRTAGDVGAMWGESGFGPAEMLRQTVGENYRNGVFWQNDPDALILRDYHLFLQPHEIKALALFQGLSGGMLYTSETLHKILPQRAELFNFLKPVTDKILTPAFPLWKEGEKDIIVLTHSNAGRHIILLLNKSAANAAFYYELGTLVPQTELFIKEYEKPASGKKQAALGGEISAHSCRMFFADESNAIEHDPENIWDILKLV